MVHAVALRPGRPAAYRSRWVATEAVARALGIDPVPGPAPAPVDIVATNIVIFGDRILALGQGALAYELDDDLATLGRIDLAGGGRGICAHPQIDPFTGALHLVSHAHEAAHHVVPPGSQTRLTRPIGNAPGPVEDVLLTGDRVVFLGAGFVGVTGRTGEARPHWLDAHLAGAVNAHDEGRAVTVLATGTSLDRWTIAGGSPRHDVLDDTPQRLGQTNSRTDARPECLWSTAAVGGTELYRHDLRTGRRTSHDFGAGHHPGEFSFVADPSRSGEEDDGWLIGLVHDVRRNEADLFVLDAAALERPPLATVHIPQPVPHGLHGTWAPARGATPGPPPSTPPAPILDRARRTATTPGPMSPIRTDNPQLRQEPR